MPARDGNVRSNPTPIRRLPSSRRSRLSSRQTPRSLISVRVGGRRARDRENLDDSEPERQRVDKWLWHARVVRTRELAAALATAGHVRVNGTKVGAPAAPVRFGDVVTVALDRSVRIMRVRGFASRRGGAEDARRLFEDLA
ncbi:MAG: hypothetical protein JO228_15725 [Xanthobacteraceae bacterium]|nr:hypothetical protein [Xanthobacteraceae bacterium]